VNKLSRVTVLHVNVPKSITCYEQHVLPLNVLYNTCVKVKRFISTVSENVSREHVSD